jgi:hypothetical protein
MSIWDNMKRSEQKSDSRKEAQGSNFTITFSTESIEVPVGTSLRDALMKNHILLGYDGSRVVTWRDSRGVVNETTIGEAGQVYSASVALETKGL